MLTEEKDLVHGTKAGQRAHARERGSWRLFPQPFDLVSSLLYIGALVPFLYDFARGIDYDPPLVPWQAVLMLLTIMLLLFLDRVEYRLYAEDTPRRAALIFMGTRIVLIEIVSWLDQFRYAPFLYLILLYLICLHFGELAGYSMTVLTWIVYVCKHMYYSSDWLSKGTELHYLVLFTVGCMFSVAIARVVLREKASRARAEELLAELEVSHRQLREYSAQVEELAATRERNRLARDIHDSLGHYLTVISVQLEKAQLFRAKRPQEAEQAVRDARRIVSEALQDVRRSVSALRSMRQLPALVPSIAKLVENVQGEHCAVDLAIEGSEEDFPAQVLLTLYRVVQEGLTNVQKHAQADHIWIALRFEHQQVLLTIRDNGCGIGVQSDQAGTTGGYGLQGLRERLELVGGTLEIKGAPGEGTELLVSIPRVSSVDLFN